MNELTHFDAQGQAHMVDVGAKPATHRIAIAEGYITMQPETITIIQAGTAKKGDVLGVARWRLKTASAIGGAKAHAGEHIGDGAQAVHAGERLVPLVGLIAVHGLQKGG